MVKAQLILKMVIFLEIARPINYFIIHLTLEITLAIKASNE